MKELQQEQELWADIPQEAELQPQPEKGGEAEPEIELDVELQPLAEDEIAQDKAEPQQENKKRSGISVFYDYLETFCYALGVMMVLLLFVFRMVSVSGSSMRTTLEDNDKLIISNLFYTPKTGDIVVISPKTNEQEPIIKRVIATGGQKVFIDYEKWEVYVDGEKLNEPYIEGMREYYGDTPMNGSDNPRFNSEFTVTEGCLFVMGDNRNGSADSRSSRYGEIDESRVLGRVIIRLAPHFGFVD